MPIIFMLVAAIFIFAISKSIAQWSYNNSQPVLTVPARVIAKRSDTSGSAMNNPSGTVSTSYYATYELESGERLEFCVGAREYGMLAEGDRGDISYQGTRYKGFDRLI